MNRLEVARQAWTLDRRAHAARRREREALARAGAAAFESSRASGEAPAGPAGDALRRLEAQESRIAALRSALDASLAADRRDWARSSERMRWVVVARGALDRWILRQESRRAAREKPALESELGRIALDGDAGFRAHVPRAVATDAEAARADLAALRAERARLLEPYGGRALPAWMSKVLEELGIFLDFVRRELSRKVFLRAPAIAGLLVGWWVASAFTDNALERVLARLGIGHGRTAVSRDTLELLAFWLPLLAAAVCAYAGARIGARVQRKYAPPKEEPVEPARPREAEPLSGVPRKP